MTAEPHNTTRLRGLKKRSQFLRAARGIRAGRASFALQAIASEHELPGIGFTVTKKTGNSPERNRIKRRLRAAAGACATGFQPQHDYVLVGRREALAAPFDELVNDLTGLLTRVHTKKADGLRNQRP
ncbi:MAG: Ribonuclease protein component [Hyphomicrobiales bacterium]|nr:Ribonuclease protein component [Hyphomicrobiales bacterium]